nr:unnamed protein product [Digitaria exilis]
MDARRDEEAVATPLIAAPAQAAGGRSHAADGHFLSTAFLFIFSAYSAAQNLQTSINTVRAATILPSVVVQEGGLGTVSMGITYTSLTLFSVASSPLVTRMGPKRALVVGSSGYVLFILANLLPTWCVLPVVADRDPFPVGFIMRTDVSLCPGDWYTMVPTSLYLGFTASIIWVGQGTYLTSAALSHARENNLPEGPTLGSFNGEFWGMFASTQVIGNLISLALLRNDKDRRMLLTIPLIVYSGLQQAFVWAVFTKSIVTPVLGISGVGGAMAIYGAADVVCSLVAGRLTSGLRSAAVIVSVGAILQAIVLFWLLLFYSPMAGLLGAAIPLFIGALWGVGDGVLNTQISALLGLLFEDVKEAAFAQLKVWQSGAIAVIFFLSPSITLQAMLILMTAGLFISFGSFLFLTLVVEKSPTTRT